MLIFLQYYWPFDEPIFTYLETINEITTLFFLYHMFTFTDWVPKAEVRYLLGWSFIAFTVTNLTLHIVLVIKETIKNTSHKWKVAAHKIRVKKILKQRKINRAEDEK